MMNTKTSQLDKRDQQLLVSANSVSRRLSLELDAGIEWLEEIGVTLLHVFLSLPCLYTR